MKRFKIGIAAVVAFLAMSFTIANHEGAFKAKTHVYDGTCAVGDAIDFNYYDGNCTTTDHNLVRDGVLACPTANLVNKIVKSITTTQATSSFTCTGSTNFCCAELVDDVNCGTPGKKISAILCYDAP